MTSPKQTHQFLSREEALRRLELLREENRGLTEAEKNFHGVSLRGIDMQGLNLSGADFSEADLSEANLFVAAKKCSLSEIQQWSKINEEEYCSSFCSRFVRINNVELAEN